MTGRVIKTAAELRKWRETAGLSQNDAADLIGCSRRGIQLWEAGTNKSPKYIGLAIEAVNARLEKGKK